MKIGQEVYVKGIVDEIRKDIVIIRNDGGYFGTVPNEIIERCDMAKSDETAKDIPEPYIVEDDMDDYRTRVWAEPIAVDGEFAIQVGTKFDKYWRQGSKCYRQRGGEPVWHEISQVKYDKAYENFCYLRILNSR